jgi:hypothetical protein
MFFGRARETRLIVAGSEIADHAMNRKEPKITDCQYGNITTIRNPAIAMELKMRSARRVPNLSDRYPPGKE